MFQLKLFVHQRLHAAAEDILGQVEKAIVLALSEAEGARSKDLAEGLLHQLSPPAKETGFPLTTSTTEHGDESNASVLQENLDSTEVSNFCPDPEVPGPSQSSADLDTGDRNFAPTDFKMVELKKEEADENQTPETVTVFLSPGFMESEQDQPQPLKIELVSFNSVAPLGESNDDELMNSTGGNEDENDEAGSHPPKEDKERRFCRLCGKSYVQRGSLRNHMKTHKGVKECGYCGLKHKTTSKLITHLKHFHKKSLFCDVCGKTYVTKIFLTRHSQTHTGSKNFVCQECGKAFYCKEHLNGHLRTHSGFPLTTSTTEHGDESNASVLQENLDSTEVSNFCPDPEVPGPSQSSADLDTGDRSFAPTDFKMVELKKEEADENQTPETVTVFLSPGFMESEQDQPQPLKIELVSFNSVAPLGESNDDELMNSTGGNEDENDEAGSHPKEDKERSFCKLCGKSYIHSGSLRNHMKKHEGIKDCGYCGLKHKTTSELFTHLKHFHEKSHFCDICGKTYASKIYLTRHSQTHTGKKDFVCQECGKAFYCKEHLNGHVRVHFSEKPYLRQIRGKALSKSQSVAVHTGEKPYHCHQCDRLFVTSSALNKHLRRYHVREKPVSCDVNSPRMKMHKTTHTGKTPYACTVCGKSFRFGSNLKVHMENH